MREESSQTELQDVLKLKVSFNEEITILGGSKLDGTSRTRYDFNKDEDKLDKWLVRITNNIKSSTTVADKADTLRRVENLFENYYTISGYTVNHPLYRSARLTLFRIGEVLLESEVITENSLNKLNELLESIGVDYKAYNLYRNLKNNPKSGPTEGPIISYVENIIEASIGKGAFSRTTHEVLINQFLEGYTQQIETYRLSQDKLSNYDQTIRKDLINSILSRCPPLRVILASSMADFSEVLFNKRWDSLKDGFLKEDGHPQFHTVFQIIYNAYEWTTSQLDKKYGVVISYDEFSMMQRTIRDTVFDWMVSANYQPRLFNSKLLRNNDPKAPELMLIYNLWNAIVRHENNPDISIKKILDKKILGHDAPLTWNTREGYCFAENTVKKFSKTIDDWIISESNKNSGKDQQKLAAYQRADRTISFYAQLRGLDLKGGITAKDPSDRGDFNKDQAKVYNIILGLGRHVGFDPGFFRPITDEMFGMTQVQKDLFKDLGEKLYVYIRHHFKNDPDRASISILDQVLIDTRSHTYWEKRMSGDHARVATQVLENLIKYNRDIDRTDIEKEFGKFADKYRVIMENWFSEPDFVDNIKLFNRRKDEIKTKPLDEFIENNYPNAYDRFYVKMLKTRRVSIRDIIQTMHPYIDISELINLGTNDDYIGPYTRVFTEILRFYNYPVRFYAYD